MPVLAHVGFERMQTDNVNFKSHPVEEPKQPLNRCQNFQLIRLRLIVLLLVGTL